MDRTRRQLVAAAAATLAWPHAAMGQAARLKRVAWISSRSEAFKKRVRDLMASRGLVEGKDLSLRFEAFAEPVFDVDGDQGLVDSIVEAAPDAIVAWGHFGLRLLQKATRQIPIVFYNLGFNPVRLGLVAELRRPGGNITGATMPWDQIEERRWQMLKEFVPSMARAGRLVIKDFWDRGRLGRDAFERASLQMYEEANRFAESRLGIEVRHVIYRREASESELLALISDAHVDALLLSGSSTPQLVSALRRIKIPASGHEGFLVSVIPDFEEGRQYAADCLARILRGESPATIPVYRNNRFRVIVNRAVAKAMGISIPPAVILQADEIVD